MKKLIFAIAIVFASISQAGSLCSLGSYLGNLKNGKCHLEIPGQAFDYYENNNISDDGNFNYLGKSYQIKPMEKHAEWIPVWDDLKVLGKDIKKNKKTISCIAQASGLTYKAVIPCATCITGGMLTGGALVAACQMVCAGSVVGVGYLVDTCL